jgi:S-formylglutathione hydrolase FrmB
MARGNKYWTYISEELPELSRSFFPLSAAREDNFVAGLSMGGYGAFKLALRCPHKFSAAASLSGAVDMAARVRGMQEEDRIAEFRNIFGDDLKISGTDEDIMHLAEKVAASAGPKPRLYQCCGTEDFLYDDNVRFKQHAENLKLDLTYEEGPGTHEWGYWDMQIQCVLKWLNI